MRMNNKIPVIYFKRDKYEVTFVLFCSMRVGGWLINALQEMQLDERKALVTKFGINL